MTNPKFHLHISSVTLKFIDRKCWWSVVDFLGCKHLPLWTADWTCLPVKKHCSVLFFSRCKERLRGRGHHQFSSSTPLLQPAGLFFLAALLSTESAAEKNKSHLLLPFLLTLTNVFNICCGHYYKKQILPWTVLCRCWLRVDCCLNSGGFLWWIKQVLQG